MNIKHLEAFKTIVELGSFTRAAEKLAMSQPAVSKLIFLLERKCGFSLFHRQKNGVIPTEEGLMLYDEVKRVYLGVETVSARAKAIKNLSYGQVKLVAFPSLATRVLPPLLAGYIEAHPGINIELFSRHSSLIVERLATQDMDFGLGMYELERPGVRFEKLCSMRAVCVLPSTHPLATRSSIHATDLRAERFVGLVAEDRAQLKIDRVFSDAGVARDMVLKVQLTEACCSFVSAGVGVSVVDPLSTDGFGQNQLAVKPFYPVVEYDVWVLMPTFRAPSIATVALVEHISKGLRRKLKSMSEMIGEDL